MAVAMAMKQANSKEQINPILDRTLTMILQRLIVQTTYDS